MPEMTFAELVRSDLRRIRPDALDGGPRAWLRIATWLLVNPSLQLAVLTRVAQRGPRILQWPVRWLQVTLFSSEVYWFRRDGAIELGPGVSFPHPIGILIGPGTRIGTGVTIYNNTGIGSDRDWRVGVPNERSCTIEDGAVVHQYTAVQGPYRVGAGAVVGAYVVLDADVPPGALRTRGGLKLAGEWDPDR